MPSSYEKAQRPISRGKRKPKSLRKGHNVMVPLNEAERDALDAQVDRFGIEISTYLRTLILAVQAGELRPDSLFQS